MTIEKFKDCVDTQDTLGAILAISGIPQLNKTYEELVDETPLTYAAGEGLVNMVGALIEAGADVNMPDARYWTALHMTTSIEVIELLIKHGASIDPETWDGWTPLHITSVDGDVSRAKLFLESGANIEAKKNDGWTALHLAAYNNHSKLVETLIKAGADSSVKTDNGDTALDLAVTNENSNVVRILNILSATQLSRKGIYT